MHHKQVGDQLTQARLHTHTAETTRLTRDRMDNVKTDTQQFLSDQYPTRPQYVTSNTSASSLIYQTTQTSTGKLLSRDNGQTSMEVMDSPVSSLLEGRRPKVNPHYE